MKFKLWSFKQRILKNINNITNSQLYTKLSMSLLINTTKVFLLIVLILSILFSFAPNTAHIRIDETTNDFSGDIYSSNLSGELEARAIDIYPRSLKEQTLQLSFDHITVDNVTYDNSYKVVVRSLSTYGFISVTARSLEYLNINIFGNLDSSERVVKTKMYMYNFETTSNDDLRFALNNDIQVFSFYDVEAYLVKNSSKINISNSICEVSSKIGAKITLNPDTVFKISNSSPYERPEPLKFSINLYGVTYLNGIISGEIAFSYTPEIKLFKANRQELILESMRDSLYMKVDSDEKANASLSGMVCEASISGMDLFPTFNGWYRDNVYLIPLTLVSTIFGGISITKKNNK